MTSVHDDGQGNGEDNLDGGIKPLAPTDPVRIGPYLLLGRLGAGGMGRVYLARSEGGRTVAVKVVHPEHVADPQFRARFRREVDAARRVGERYTAPVLDAAPDAEYPWVATGYVPGLSLEQVVRGHGALPAASVRALADGLLRALEDIHAAGIIHRDLKPSNVMLTVEGPKVIDFGIARAVETSVDSLLTSTGMVIGSPGFMAPEQIRGESTVPRSDVFTLGCVLTYAATGTLPFGNGVSNQHAVMYHIVEAEPDIAHVRDEGLRALITRLLTKSVDERPTVGELLAERDGVPVASPWLPAGVVDHLARQSARLLDAEAAPIREEAVDRGTVDLRAPEVAVAGVPVHGTAEPRREREGRRRQWIVAVPLVVVLAGGGGTLAVLQPFGGDSPSHASPSSGAPVSPLPSSLLPASPSAPSRSGLPPGHRSPQASSSEKKGRDGNEGSDGEDGRDGAGPGGGAGTAGGGAGSGGGSDATGGGGSSSGGSTGGATPGGTTTGGTTTGGGSTGGVSTGGVSTGGGSGSGGSGSTSGSTTGSGGTSGTSGTSGTTGSTGSTGSTGGSGGGSTVPSAFVGTWKYGSTFNVGQPDTITISRSGVVRLTGFPYSTCPYEAKVTSTTNGSSRIHVGTAELGSPNSGFCPATLAASYFSLNGSGIQHNVGAAHADGYYYKRA